MVDRLKIGTMAGGSAAAGPPERPVQDVPLRDADQFEPAVNQFRGNRAAKKIQKAFKDFQTNKAAKAPLVDAKAKAIIEREMIEVNKIIEYSTTAHKVNLGILGKDEDSNENEKVIVFDRRRKIQEYRKRPMIGRMKGVIDDRIGNCGDSARLLAIFLKESPELNAEIKNAVRLARLSTPEDHAFVAIGDLNDENQCIIVDPWVKYLDFYAKPGFRKETVPATEKSRGFLGSLKQYKTFLEAHADGQFVQAGEAHEVIGIELEASPEERGAIVSFARKKNAS